MHLILSVLRQGKCIGSSLPWPQSRSIPLGVSDVRASTWSPASPGPRAGPFLLACRTSGQVHGVQPPLPPGQVQSPWRVGRQGKYMESSLPCPQGRSSPLGVSDVRASTWSPASPAPRAGPVPLACRTSGQVHGVQPPLPPGQVHSSWRVGRQGKYMESSLPCPQGRSSPLGVSDVRASTWSPASPAPRAGPVPLACRTSGQVHGVQPPLPPGQVHSSWRVGRQGGYMESSLPCPQDRSIPHGVSDVRAGTWSPASPAPRTGPFLLACRTSGRVHGVQLPLPPGQVHSSWRVGRQGGCMESSPPCPQGKSSPLGVSEVRAGAWGPFSPASRASPVLLACRRLGRVHGVHSPLPPGQVQSSWRVGCQGRCMESSLPCPQDRISVDGMAYIQESCTLYNVSCST